MNKKILVLNGPGLADLSAVKIGSLTMGSLQPKCSSLCERLGLDLDFRQAKESEELYRSILDSNNNCDALIINPAARSQAAAVDFGKICSAIETVAKQDKPIVEVHLTNIFHEHSEAMSPLHVRECQLGFVCGLGAHSYLLAISAAAKRLQAGAS